MIVRTLTGDQIPPNHEIVIEVTVHTPTGVRTVGTKKALPVLPDVVQSAIAIAVHLDEMVIAIQPEIIRELGIEIPEEHQ